ncbi:MAG: hypothetical protein JXX29_04925 [Deltaproteobacteria bacterium]|nr:hypothetical protein [Deltaproteobacteria bacterium]MBN2670990.1 hypothetical protein [Deltaproteobacteria bacterium]
MGLREKSNVRLIFVVCVCFFVWGCSKQNVPVQSVDSTMSATAHWRLGLEKAQARDFDGAVAEVTAASQKEPLIKYEIALAHFAFLAKDYKEARKRYQALVDSKKLDKTQTESLRGEIERIDAADGDVVGASVAGQWLRSTVAVIEAEEAIEIEDYVTAYKSYDTAYQYNQDYTLLLESALCASKAKQWDWAYKKYKEYMAVGGTEITRDMAYRIVAETDRIKSILKGEDVVTDKSLADEIFAERRGEEEADELPPSMKEEQEAKQNGTSENETDEGQKVAEADTGQIEEPVAVEMTEAEKKKAEKEQAAFEAAEKRRLEKEQREKEAEERKLAREAERQERAAAREAAAEKRKQELAEKRAALEAAKKERAEKKRFAQEEAMRKVEEAKERKLALKKEQDAQRQAALEEKRREDEERKAALAAKREEEKRKRDEANAKREEELKQKAEERRLATEAAAREKEMQRQEEEARRKETEAARRADKAKKLAEKERLEEEQRIAAEDAHKKAEEERAVAAAERQKAQEARERLKEEQRLAALAKKEAEKQRLAELKAQREEEKRQKAEDARRKAEEKKALAEQKRLEREEQKRAAIEKRKAEEEERRAEKERKKAEQELARQEREREKELARLKKEEEIEAKRIAREEAEEAKRLAREEAQEAKRREREERAAAEQERLAATQAERISEKSTVKQSQHAGAEAQPGVAGAEESTYTVPMSVAKTTVEDLVFYTNSKSATVRYKAVKELIPIMDDRARVALETRIINDRNMHVRFLAISGLVQRDSTASLPVLEHALMTAATSQERAMLKSAIQEIRLGIK